LEKLWERERDSENQSGREKEPGKHPALVKVSGGRLVLEKGQGKFLVRAPVQVRERVESSADQVEPVLE